MLGRPAVGGWARALSTFPAATAAKQPQKRRFRHLFDTASTGADHFRTAVTAAFRLIDRDHDGFASRDEIARALRKYTLVQELLQIPANPTDAEFATFIDLMDPAHGEMISEGKWREFFCPEQGALERPGPQRYDPHTSGITGFLIDLDGTIYRPGGLIPGARTFYRWLLESGTPHAFLSNTGSKGPEGTRDKLRTPPYELHPLPVPISRIMTAADAQADFLTRTLPPGSRVLCVSGGGSFWRTLLERRDEALVRTWQIMTALTDDEAMDWAVEARRARARAQPHEPRVVVAFFLDGEVSAHDSAELATIADASAAAGAGADCAARLRALGETRGSGWNYTLIKHCAFLLGHGASLVYTADDPFNPQTDPDRRHGDTVFQLPGPGMFASMLRPVVPLDSHDRFLCCGKGGNVGATYIMDAAIEMLHEQGHSGDRDRIMMVGDRFGTDVRGATHAGITSCLVESGCEKASDQAYYPTDQATWCAPSVDYLHPLGPGLEERAERASK